MRRPVKYAKFHEGIFIPGVGDLGKTLPSPMKTLPDLEMNLEDTVLEINTKHQTIYVPLANVAFMHADTSGEGAVAPAVVKVNTRTGVVGKA